MTIQNALSKAAEQYSGKDALIFKEQRVSFQQLQSQTFRLAAALKDLGIQKGDKVAIYLPNSVEYCVSYLAVFTLGAVGVPLDFMLKEDELVSCIGHSEAKIVIGLSHSDISLTRIAESCPNLQTIVSVKPEEGQFYGELLQKFTELTEFPVIADSDPALIMYTSGTTGKPKGILLNYRHLTGSPQAMHHFVDLTQEDIKICAIPLSHIGGFIYLQNCLYFGITVILMDRFNPIKFLSLIQEHKVTCFHIVPPMYNALLTLKSIDNYDLSSLRWVVVFGAPSSPEIMERFHKYCPNARLLNGWGMTETCPPNTVTPLDSDNIASVGKPAPHCVIKIVDDMGNELPNGESGEIVISGWIIMDEYYKDPEATAAMKKGDMLYTGDIGRFDENGFLYIVGRKKEMIKVAGQIVYAPEVENVLYQNPAIAEAAVIGVADDMRGEVVKAYVVLHNGNAQTEEEIRYFCKEHLANFKVPHYVEIVQDLPKNRTGKIDKSVLKTLETSKG